MKLFWCGKSIQINDKYRSNIKRTQKLSSRRVSDEAYNP